MEQPERPLTFRVHQVSKLLNVSVKTMYRWLETGDLPSVRIRRVILIRPDDFDAFLAEPRRPEKRWSVRGGPRAR